MIAAPTTVTAVYDPPPSSLAMHPMHNDLNGANLDSVLGAANNGLSQEPMVHREGEEPLPTTYAKLPKTTKLEEEPNPFEKSFSRADSPLNDGPCTNAKPMLPPVGSIASPSKSTVHSMVWDSLQTGPSPPSMLQGPTDPSATTMNRSINNLGFRPIASTTSLSAETANEAPYLVNESTCSTTIDRVVPPAPPPTSANLSKPTVTSRYDRRPHSPAFIHHTYPDPSSVNRARGTSLANSVEDASSADSENKHDIQPARPKRSRTTKRPSAASRHIQDEEKRKNFLERNRQAALKCRQRKKEWLQNLQTRVEYLTVDNEQLQLQTSSLREELLNLKTILLAHKDCPIGQEAMLKLIHRPIPGLSAMGQITPPSTASPQHESDHPASAPEN